MAKKFFVSCCLIAALLVLVLNEKNTEAQATLPWGVSVTSLSGATGTATGTSFALISNPAAVVTVVVDITGTVTSNTILLEGSLNNSSWFPLYSSTTNTDHTFTALTAVKFVRPRVSAHGGGGGTTDIYLIAKGSPASANSLFSGGSILNPLLAQNGTAAAPSYSFSSDPDNGMFLSAEADTVSFSAGGVEAGRFTSGGGLRTGNVRFGVSGTGPTISANGTNIQIRDTAGTGFGLLLFGGGTTAFPALKRNSATLEVKLADDSGFASFSSGPQTVNGSLTLTSITFATLPADSNGVIRFCSDCTIANPCAGGGTGAFAKRLNGVWVCN